MTQTGALWQSRRVGGGGDGRELQQGGATGGGGGEMLDCHMLSCLWCLH